MNTYQRIVLKLLIVIAQYLLWQRDTRFRTSLEDAVIDAESVLSRDT